MEFHTLNNMFRFSKEFGHEKHRATDISQTECLICSYIHSHPGCSQDAVAQNMHMDKTTIARILQTLENKNFVVREIAVVDRRRKSLRLTELGTEQITNIMKLHDEWLNDVLSCLSPEERAQFEMFFVRLLEKAEKKISAAREAEEAD